MPAKSVLMIEPVAFGSNPDSAQNFFMRSDAGGLPLAEVQARTLR